MDIFIHTHTTLRAVRLLISTCSGSIYLGEDQGTKSRFEFLRLHLLLSDQFDRVGAWSPGNKTGNHKVVDSSFI